MNSNICKMNASSIDEIHIKRMVFVLDIMCENEGIRIADRKYKHTMHVLGPSVNKGNIDDFYRQIVNRIINKTIKLPFEIDFDKVEFCMEDGFISINHDGHTTSIGFIKYEDVVYGRCNYARASKPETYADKGMRILYSDFRCFIKDGDDKWTISHMRKDDGTGRYRYFDVAIVNDTGDIDNVIEAILNYRTNYENECNGIHDFN